MCGFLAAVVALLFAVALVGVEATVLLIAAICVATILLARLTNGRQA